MKVVNKLLILHQIPSFIIHTCLYFQNQGKPGHEVQSSTLELINGLVSLVHQQWMPEDVAQEAMEVKQLIHPKSASGLTLLYQLDKSVFGLSGFG